MFSILNNGSKPISCTLARAIETWHFCFPTWCFYPLISPQQKTARCFIGEFKGVYWSELHFPQFPIVVKLGGCLFQGYFRSMHSFTYRVNVKYGSQMLSNFPISSLFLVKSTKPNFNHFLPTSPVHSGRQRVVYNISLSIGRNQSKVDHVESFFHRN